MSSKQHLIQTGRQVYLVAIAILLLTGFCFGQAAVSLLPKDGPPTTTLQVSGSGFTPYAQVDIYFDNKDEALSVADGAGSFSQIAIQAPASAVPGTHWVSAVERSGHLVKQEVFEVHVNWTEFHTQDMRRENLYENVLNVDNVGRLHRKGSCQTRGEVDSSPAVANGVVYVGSDDNNVYALDVHTGAKLWAYATGDRVMPSPAVANGVVYVGSDDSNIYALDARTGAKVWSYTTGLWVEASPAVVNGVVYVGSYDGNIYALDASTGALLWSYATVCYPASCGVYSSPAVVNGVVYVGTYYWCDPNCSANPTLYALDARTGSLLWSYVTDCSLYNCGVVSSPAVANGVVYVGSLDNKVYALSARTGALLWTYTTGDQVWCSPAVANGVVYVGSSYADGNLYALDARTGAKLWAYATGTMVYSSPAVANGVVYVGSLDHNLYALDASTGALLWSYTTGDMVASSPTVVNGVVYVGAYDGKMYAFGLPPGLVEPAPKRPDPKALRPDFNLKPTSTTAAE